MEGMTVPITLPKATEIAATIYNDLEPYCSRLVVAGSVRRRKSHDIKDIEFVAIPRYLMQPNLTMTMQPTGENLLFRHIHRNYNIVSGGKDGQRKAVFDADSTKIEIYGATEESFGYILMIRTGPAEFSKMMVTKMKARGYVPKDGVVRRGGQVVPTPTEQIAFKVAGTTYRKPEAR